MIHPSTTPQLQGSTQAAGGPGLLPGAILNFGQQNQVTVGAPEPDEGSRDFRDLGGYEAWPAG